MSAVFVGSDQVDGVDIVELIDLVVAIDDRHVPAKQVDEEALAVGKHGLQQRPICRCQLAIDDMDHGCAPGGDFTAEGSSDRVCRIDRVITRVDALQVQRGQSRLLTAR